MVVVSAGYVGGTHSSCIVSSAADVLWMSVVFGTLVGVVVFGVMWWLSDDICY